MPRTVGNAKPSRPAAPRPHNPSGTAGTNRKPFRPGPVNSGMNRVAYRSKPDFAPESKGTGRG